MNRAEAEKLVDSLIETRMDPDRTAEFEEDYEAVIEAMTRPASARHGEYVAPIARVRIIDGCAVTVTTYAPGLPDGEHDLYPVGMPRSEPIPISAGTHAPLYQEVLVFDGNSWGVGKYHGHGEYSHTSYPVLGQCKATHWMHLPEPVVKPTL